MCESQLSTHLCTYMCAMETGCHPLHGNSIFINTFCENPISLGTFWIRLNGIKHVIELVLKCSVCGVCCVITQSQYVLAKRPHAADTQLCHLVFIHASHYSLRKHLFHIHDSSSETHCMIKTV